MSETEIVPPRRIAFCGNQLSRDSWCGRPIFDNDIEAVELLTDKPLIICGPCVTQMIDSICTKATREEILAERRAHHRGRGTRHYRKFIPPGDFL